MCIFRKKKKPTNSSSSNNSSSDAGPELVLEPQYKPQKKEKHLIENVSSDNIAEKEKLQQHQQEIEINLSFLHSTSKKKRLENPTIKSEELTSEKYEAFEPISSPEEINQYKELDDNENVDYYSQEEMSAEDLMLLEAQVDAMDWDMELER